MDFLKNKEQYTWFIHPLYIGKEPLPKWFKAPDVIPVDYSYVEYMNRRSNGAMFPLCDVKHCVMYYHNVDSYVRIYETYKCYTKMYLNISERKYMYKERLATHEADLDDLKENGFKWSIDFADVKED